MTHPCKLRLRPNFTDATLDGRAIDVELPPSMLQLNAHLIAELVEDLPTLIKTATVDPGLSSDERLERFAAAVQTTLRSHKFSMAQAQVDLGDGEWSFIHAVRGPAPWTTAFAFAMASGWCPLDEFSGQALFIAIPRRDVVFFVPQTRLDSEPRLLGALRVVAKHGFEAVQDEDAFMPIVFKASEGDLVAIDGDAAPAFSIDSRRAADIEDNDPMHSTMRRLLAALSEASYAQGNTELAGGLAEVASQSCSVDALLGGEMFLPALGTVLGRATDQFDATLQPSVATLSGAIASGDGLGTAVRGVYEALANGHGQLEEQLVALDPWFAKHLSEMLARVDIEDDDLAGFGHRVAWLALHALRPHLGADCAADLARLGTAALSDEPHLGRATVPSALALLRPHLGRCHAAVRLAFERVTWALTHLYLGLELGTEPDSTRRLVADALAAWQWTRGGLATTPPTTPFALPEDAGVSVDALVEQWQEHDGEAWVRGAQRAASRIVLELEDGEQGAANDVAKDELQLHAAAIAEAIERHAATAPPEAADLMAALRERLGRWCDEAGLQPAERSAVATFLDGNTADAIDEADLGDVFALICAAFSLTVGGEPAEAQLVHLVAFLERGSAPTVAKVRDELGTEGPIGGVLRKVFAEADTDPETATMGLLLKLASGASELKRSPDWQAVLDSLAATLNEVAGETRGWWGMGSAPSKASRTRLENTLNLLSASMA